MRNWLFLALLVGSASFTNAQSPILDQLVATGFSGNAALRQSQFRLRQHLAALEEARGVFLPHLTLMADYTLANGGRRIDLPVGTLLNPVYSTLNQLTQQKVFPQIENVSEQFLPNNFHDTKLRTSMPLFNRTASLHAAIKAEALQGSGAEIRVYQRSLMLAIREAYFLWLKATEGIRIYQSAQLLLEENLKLTASLVKQGIALPIARLQLKKDLSVTESQLNDIRNQEVLAVMQINFLLNLPAERPIERDTSLLNPNHPWQRPLPSGQLSVQREEIEQIQSGIKQLKLAERLQRASGIPELSAFADLGFQGFGFNLGNRQAYALGGISLRWNLYQGNQRSQRQHQAQFQRQETESKLEETERLLQLELEQANRQHAQTMVQLQAADEQLHLAEEVYRLTQARYRQGEALSIELSQALQQLTAAQLQQRISLINRLIARAHWERVSATESLSYPNNPTNSIR